MSLQARENGNRLFMKLSVRESKSIGGAMNPSVRKSEP